MSSPQTIQIRVLLVDDNQRLIAAWSRLLGRQPDVHLVGSLERADGLTDAAHTLKPDVILIDLTMEGRDPLEAIGEIRRDFPAIRTLVYSAHSGPDWKKRAMNAGAHAFLDKADDPMEIVNAIRQACSPPSRSP